MRPWSQILILKQNIPKAARQGSYEQVDIVPSYVDHLLSYIDTKEIAPLNIVANPGNGGAGPIVKELAKHLPCHFTYLNDTPDGHFPNGVPNPLLVENRDATSDAVRREGADLGIAWDGDFDRCFFFDEMDASSKGIILSVFLPLTSSRSIPVPRSSLTRA